MRRYARLSDNPSVIARSLKLEAALKDNKIYRETHDNATAMLKHSEAALNQILEAARAIRGLVVRAGDGTLPREQVADCYIIILFYDFPKTAFVGTDTAKIFILFPAPSGLAGTGDRYQLVP